jgi:hypothetical protein
LTPPSRYTRNEVRKLLRGRFTLRERRDNIDVLVRLLDLDSGVFRLMREHREEARAVIVCGFFQVQFRDAEAILGDDHVTIHEVYSSGVAHLTDYMNGHE